jgi:ubiquinone/menaquinone biosynthesis C-methylase UbiE
MKKSDAVELIRNGISTLSVPSAWADLGCGSGTFTKALAELLPPGSSLIAIDKEHHEIGSHKAVTIQFNQADFTQTDSLPINLDGVLMANALHYVKDQHRFLAGLNRHLKSNGRIVIIEYDTDMANQWVPYPVTFGRIEKLLTDSAFHSVTKIGEIPSVYNASKMYAAMAFNR